MNIIDVLFSIQKNVTSIKSQGQVAVGLSDTMSVAYCSITFLENKAEVIIIANTVIVVTTSATIFTTTPSFFGLKVG